MKKWLVESKETTLETNLTVFIHSQLLALNFQFTMLSAGQGRDDL